MNKDDKVLKKVFNFYRDNQTDVADYYIAENDKISIMNKFREYRRLTMVLTAENLALKARIQMLEEQNESIKSI